MKEKFIELLKEVFEMDDQEMNMDDVFRDYDTWDSLTHLSLIAMLDDDYSVQIEDEEFKKMITVSDLYKKVAK
ncbi:MAG: acyl carrier protein [Lutibacter sp.]|uniref:acyl carrier protein n=1 Tax=Lutibacter sp. TaxID=1925666 RepID=UPI0019E7A3BF|nr:acyl carrier protein [Lutibacter sp.]NOR28399.1 acyl carrier protein [Lutibacter sp.]